MVLERAHKRYRDAVLDKCKEYGLDECGQMYLNNTLVHLLKRFEIFSKYDKRHIEILKILRSGYRCKHKIKDEYCYVCGDMMMDVDNIIDFSERRTSCAKGEDSPAQNTKEICHTAPNK